MWEAENRPRMGGTSTEDSRSKSIIAPAVDRTTHVALSGRTCVVGVGQIEAGSNAGTTEKSATTHVALRGRTCMVCVGTVEVNSDQSWNRTSEGEPSEGQLLLSLVRVRRTAVDFINTSSEDLSFQSRVDSYSNSRGIAFASISCRSRSAHPLGLPRDSLISARTFKGQPYFCSDFCETVFTSVGVSLVDSVIFQRNLSCQSRGTNI
ncbi:unnamed protein product [Camellia sinensis]